jgi:hypothetical protein
MKSLRQIIFTSAMVIGLAFSVSAQKDDQKRPPKPTPPVVDPKQKPPRGNPPKGDDKPKKPGMSFYLVSTKQGNDAA